MIGASHLPEHNRRQLSILARDCIPTSRLLSTRSVRGHHSPSSLTLRSCCCLHAHHCPLNRLSLARLWLDLLLPGPVPQPSRCDTHMCTSHSAGAAAIGAGVVFVCESVSCDDSSSFSSLRRQLQWLHPLGCHRRFESRKKPSGLSQLPHQSLPRECRRCH